MANPVSRHIVADPYPEVLGFVVMTIFIPADFRGDTEIVWWLPGKKADGDKQRITCNTVALLQGLFRDVRGPRPGELFDGRVVDRPGELFDARVVALVVHAFYRTRIEAAARLETAYEWQAW
jgi:hypothetical protein